MRFNVSSASALESWLAENFLKRRLNTSIFSDLEKLLVENFLIRRFSIFIFSGLERLFFDVITQPFQCVPIFSA